MKTYFVICKEPCPACGGAGAIFNELYAELRKARDEWENRDEVKALAANSYPSFCLYRTEFEDRWFADRGYPGGSRCWPPEEWTCDDCDGKGEKRSEVELSKILGPKMVTEIAKPEALETNINWKLRPRGHIHCMNGVVDFDLLVNEGVEACLVPYHPKYGAGIQVPCRLNPEARWDRWEKFLSEIFPLEIDNGAEKAQILQQFFGYCFLQNCIFPMALFLYGFGSSGKSTTLSVLQALVGKNNTAGLTIKELARCSRRHLLEKKLINFAVQKDAFDFSLNETVKSLVAGESITAQSKLGLPYYFKPFAKLIMVSNDLAYPHRKFGMERRIVAIDFPRTFSKVEQDPELLSKLLEEKDGIFVWALLGLKRLLEHGDFNVVYNYQ